MWTLVIFEEATWEDGSGSYCVPLMHLRGTAYKPENRADLLARCDKLNSLSFQAPDKLGAIKTAHEFVRSYWLAKASATDPRQVVIWGEIVS